MDDGVDAVALDDAPDQAWSPTSPSTRVAPFGTAQAKPVERLSRTTTASPASSNSSTMWLPMYPAPPVTRTLIPLSFSHVSVACAVQLQLAAIAFLPPPMPMLALMPASASPAWLEAEI